MLCSQVVPAKLLLAYCFFRYLAIQCAAVISDLIFLALNLTVYFRQSPVPFHLAGGLLEAFQFFIIHNENRGWFDRPPDRHH